MKKLLLTIFAVAVISGCSNAGPFVTNVSSDGNNGLNIEKCSVHYNSFTGNVSTGQCSTTYVKLRSN
jgi:hypothetical protein